ncbi:HPr family phosphocarrier protein, partial [Escherichia coli]|nr:HPr family phosphocarrier protein [Escherichia coli]
MIEVSLEYESYEGLHARPATALSDIAKSCQGEVFMIHRDRVANVKNAVHLLALGIKKGSRITVQVESEGDDEQQIMDEILRVIKGIA